MFVFFNEDNEGQILQRKGRERGSMVCPQRRTMGQCCRCGHHALERGIKVSEKQERRAISSTSRFGERQLTLQKAASNSWGLKGSRYTDKNGETFRLQGCSLQTDQSSRFSSPSRGCFFPARAVAFTPLSDGIQDTLHSQWRSLSLLF